MVAANELPEPPRLPEPPDVELVEQEIGESIARTMATREGGFVIKWVALVETSDAQGQRGLWTLTSTDMLAWDTVGMLQHALHLQQAQTLMPEES